MFTLVAMGVGWRTVLFRVAGCYGLDLSGTPTATGRRPKTTLEKAAARRALTKLEAAELRAAVTSGAKRPCASSAGELEETHVMARSAPGATLAPPTDAGGRLVRGRQTDRDDDAGGVPRPAAHQQETRVSGGA
jgi:hypothetical protein